MTREWWTLVGACAGLFVLMLDSTVVALALPSIRHDIGASATGLQWAMNGYLLTIAVFVVTAGRLGDMFGRKRLFLAGMVVFALGSVVSGAAGDETTLILGRVLQGLGAAPMLPLSLAIVCDAFPAERQPAPSASGRRFRRSPWRSGHSPAAPSSNSTGGRSSGSTCRLSRSASRSSPSPPASRAIPAPGGGSTWSGCWR
jgi:MFS family permease